MASETKVEPAVKAPGATRLRGVEADDENVSLDELMLSDSDDDDEEDEATDIHPPLVRDLDEQQPSAAAAAAADSEPPPRANAKAKASSLEAEVEAPLSSRAADSSDNAPEVVIIVEDDSGAAEATSAGAGDTSDADEGDDADDAEPPSLAPDTLEPDTLAPEALAASQALAGDSDSELEAPAEAVEALASDASESASTDPEAAPEPSRSPRREPSVRAEAPDAPLPSFDIPDLEVPAPARVHRRSSAPPAAMLAPVSEAADDDAVTHMGLPVSDSSDEYPELEVSGFESGDPGLAAMREFDPNVGLIDARRATTRLIPRIDPALLQPPPERVEPAAPKSQWLTEAFQSGNVRRKVAWVLDNVLPPLSLVLFGSGIGAGIMLLQPDRPADPAGEVQQRAQALQEAAPVATKRPSTWLESAEAGDANALAKIDKLPARERTAEMTLAFETGQRARRLNEFRSLVATLENPGGTPPADLASRVIDYATAPETLVPAFQTLARWEGSQGPDLLYAVWERAPGGSRAASLAQQLLQGADQRSKASAALLVALDLRNSATCEDYAKLLPSVQRDGDQRSSATLRALEHKDGCGDDGRDDCFRCLRRGTQIASALRATESRPGPQL